MVAGAAGLLRFYEHVFVIAPQENRLNVSSCLQSDTEIHHAGAVRPTVHIIAEMYDLQLMVRKVAGVSVEQYLV